MRHLVLFSLLLALLQAPNAMAQAPQRLMSPLGRLPATFEGPVTSAGGTARWQLDLLPHGRFQLRRADPAQPAPVDDIGGYALEGRRLLLSGTQSEKVLLALADDGSLQPLAVDGRPLEAAPARGLRRLPQAAPIEPRLRLSGWFTHLADAPRIVLCADGRSLPVAMAGDYLALERAYGSARPLPGSPVWAEMEAVIAPRPSMEVGQPSQPTLVVERFVQVDPAARCLGPYADRRLTGTAWQLTWLGSDRAVVSDPGHPPALRIAAGHVLGSDGCHRVTGPAAVDGSALRLGPLEVTETACVRVPDPVPGFDKALARVRGYAIRGDELSLLDEQGVTLARLRAAR